MKSLVPDTGRVLTVAHDAGGAEVVSSWVRRRPAYDHHYVVEGPAAAIFARKLPDRMNRSASELSTLVRQSDFVLTGTGWSSDLERSAMALAREAGVPVAAFLDHWINYPLRFCTKGELALPDEIWVGDEHAEMRARRDFPGQPIRLVANPYLEDIRDELPALEARRESCDGLRVLFLTDPIEECRELPHQDLGPLDALGFTEFDALALVLARLGETGGECPAAVRLRQHPIERRGKYQRVIDAFPQVPITVSRGTSVVEDCVWADWVFGLWSSALVVALACGRRAVSVIPNPAVSSPLPHREIERWSRTSAGAGAIC